MKKNIKKLNSLQILMLMSFSLGSSFMYCQQEDDLTDQEYKEQAVQLFVASQQGEDADDEVLQDLVEMAPVMVEKIIENESDLDATFNSIKKFLSKKNNEIERLLREKNVEQVEVARLAVELKDTVAMFQKYQMRQRVQHKSDHKHEQFISDALRKSEQNLKLLHEKAGKRSRSDDSNYIGSSVDKSTGLYQLNRTTGVAKTNAAISGQIKKVNASSHKTNRDIRKKFAKPIAKGLNNYGANRKAAYKKTGKSHQSLAKGNFSEAMQYDKENLTDSFTKNPFRTPEKKSKTGSPVESGSVADLGDQDMQDEVVTQYKKYSPEEEVTDTFE